MVVPRNPRSLMKWFSCSPYTLSISYIPSVLRFFTVLVGEGLGLKDMAERSLLWPGTSSSKFSILKFLGSRVRCVIISPDVNANVLVFRAFLCVYWLWNDSTYSSYIFYSEGDYYSMTSLSTSSISLGFGSLTTSKVLLIMGFFNVEV
jgi:hypothetical protein